MTDTREAKPAPSTDMRAVLDAIRAKHREERDRRLRNDGVRQYIDPRGEFNEFLDDPLTQRVERAPLNDEIDAVVIGGGLSGLLAGARLREAGLQDVRIIDPAGDFGGTWYWNRYPNAACDTESYLYLPLLEETGYIPTAKYVKGPEIRAHARRIGEQYDLYRNACFHTKVTELRWDDAKERWRVITDREDDMSARFVVMCNAALNIPKLPGIPGIDSFKGHMFHTSRWDYAYTGGDETRPMERLADKRVAVIGTGATGVQCVPPLARDAQKLFVFQRTPPCVLERNNSPTDPEWASSLTPGWQSQRIANFTRVTNGVLEEDLVRDGWTDVATSVGTVVASTNKLEIAEDDSGLSYDEALELADYRKMESVRARVEKSVADPETVRALKPWFRLFCKRPTFSDEFLQTFNRSNVQLVDTEGRGIERITESGIVVNGVEYEVDCIVFATGFEPGASYRRAGFEVYGREGNSLTEHWCGPVRTLHGFISHGFPNYFHMGCVLTAVSFNAPTVLAEQARHIRYIVESCLERQATRVEPTVEAEDEWIALMNSKRASSEFLDSCTPGYFNNEGNTDEPGGFLETQYGGGVLEYFEILQQWREGGALKGLAVT